MSRTKGTPASSQIIWLEQRLKELEEQVQQRYSLGVADAERACLDYASGISERGRCTALACAGTIRDMSSPPSVSEKWVEQVTLSNELLLRDHLVAYKSSLATLAALGIEVTK